jgi:4-hydroxysphinganine ceramide fatty acyl 2-hydroxylase
MKDNVKEYLAFKEGKILMPEHLQPRRKSEGQLFKSKFLERVTRTPIWVPQLMFGVIITGFLWNVLTKMDFTVVETIIFFFSGLLSWSFAEYVVHRFLYHTESNSDTLYSVQHKGHGIHHQHPVDKDRLAMPPLPGLILACGFFGLFYLIMGQKSYMFFPGFLTGYLMYITMHYAQHVIGKPSYKPLQKLWNHHKVHHYTNPYKAFGVSTRLWDFIFGSMPTQEEMKKFEG